MRGDVYVFSDFSGGVDLQSQPYAVDAIRARDCLNVQSSPSGAIRKRNGFDPIATPTDPILSLFSYQSSATNVLIGFSDDGVNTGVSTITTAGTITSIKGAATITTGHLWDAVQAPIGTAIPTTEGPFYALNGQDSPLTWSGTSNVNTWNGDGGAVTGFTNGVPNGKYMLYHDNAVFIAGVPTNVTTQSTLYRSGLADPTKWLSPDMVTTLFDPADGASITGLGTVGPYVIVFKPRKAFLVTDTTTLAYRNLSDEIGCISHRSINDTDQGTFFLSSDHKVYVTDGTSLTYVSEPVQPLLDNMLESNHQKITSLYKDDSYYLSISLAQDNDTILEFNTAQASWWVHRIALTSSTTSGVSDWCILNPAGDSVVYAATPSTATPRIFYAFRENVYEDEVPYTAYWISGWNTFGQPHIRKGISQFRADALGEYSLYTNRSFNSALVPEETKVWEIADSEGGGVFGGSGTFGGGGTFGEAIGVQERRFYTPGTARAWSLKFQSDSSDRWELYAHTIGIRFRKD